MALRHTDEQQAEFARALQAVADQGALSQAEIDSLNMLEGSDLDQFRSVWERLPAGARERLLRGLRGAADSRLRLDFSAINRMALDDSDAAVRLAAVNAALEDRSPALLSRLLELVVADPSTNVRQAAAEDLSRFTLLAELDDLDADSATRLRSRLHNVIARADEAPRVRTAALAALGYFSDTQTAEDLAAGFLDPTLRLGAVRGMGRTADPRWTDRLMPVLGSDDPDLREQAARALGEIEDERAVSPLVEAVDDPEPAVRMAVIEALGHIGGEDAREALLYLVQAAEDDVAEAAERALEELEAGEGDPLDLS